MPDEKQIREYAKTLPEIYRDILAAFPVIEPRRGAGYGLAFQTLTMHFVNTHKRHGFGEVRDACLRLADAGFVEIKNGIFAHPTDLGEQLIAEVAEKPLASATVVPDLPSRPW